MATRYAELVERLKPSWSADEDGSRAASLLRSTSPALVGRLNASIVANNELKTEAAAAITALEAEVKNMHRRAQKAEGRVSAALYLIGIWLSLTSVKRDYLGRTVLDQVRRCLLRRRASTESKP